MKTQDQNNNKKLPKVENVKDYNGIIGVLLLFVVASIAYTTTVIGMGTEGILPLALALPQAIFAVVVLIVRFTK